MSDEPEHPFSPAFLEKFELKGFLGRGGMGAVYLMRQRSLDRPVAVKVLAAVLTPEDRWKLLEEARLLAKLSHGSIVAVHDVGVDGNVPYMVCEYADGESLEARLGRAPALTLAEALAIAAQVLSGLEAAHRKGIVHRDVKPANVFLTQDGDAKLGDFGIAKVLDAGTGASLGQLAGTPAYISPEQWRGERATAASDVYAMGAVLFEMVSGRRAFAGPSLEDFIVQHTAAERPRLAGGAPEVDALVARALEREPERRFAGAAELLAAVEEARRALSGAATLAAAPRPAAVDATLPALPTDARLDSGTVRPAVHLRLAFEVPGPAELAGALPEGWEPLATGDDPFGHFSKLDVRTNARFRALTRDVFVWRPDATGAPVPLVLQLDRRRLRNRLRFVPGEDRAALDLQRVELIPLAGGRALLGVWLAGGPGALRDHLAWISARNLYRSQIVEVTGRSRKSGLPFPRFVNMLAETWTAQRPTDLELAPVRSALPTMKVCQLLLVGAGEPDRDWEHARTLSPPSGPPRYVRGDAAGQWTWTHPQGHGTRYGVSDHALTAWCDPAVPFNREVKPRVFLTAYYLQWWLANELRGLSPADADALAACWQEDLRRDFTERCRAHATRLAART